MALELQSRLVHQPFDAEQKGKEGVPMSMATSVKLDYTATACCIGCTRVVTVCGLPPIHEDLSVSVRNGWAAGDGDACRLSFILGCVVM